MQSKCRIGRTLQHGKEVFEVRDGNDRQAKALLDLLNSRCVRWCVGRSASLHSIQRDKNPSGNGANALKQVDRLPYRGSRGNYVVDDQDLSAREIRSDEHPTLAVVLGLLPVIGKVHVVALRGQGNGRRGRKRDAFVSRAKEGIGPNTALAMGKQKTLCIKTGQLAQSPSVVEESGIEEIGRVAAGLRNKLAKPQDTTLDGKSKKSLGS